MSGDDAMLAARQPLPLPTLVPLAQVEPAMVEELLDAAFGPDRHRRTAYRSGRRSYFRLGPIMKRTAAIILAVVAGACAAQQTAGTPTPADATFFPEKFCRTSMPIPATMSTPTTMTRVFRMVT